MKPRIISGAFYLCFKIQDMLEPENISSELQELIHSCKKQLTGNAMSWGITSGFDMFRGKVYPNLRPWCFMRC